MSFMDKLIKPKVLIVGVGNPIRQDDDIGPYCVRIFQQESNELKKKLVDCMTVHQLDVLHCEIFARYQCIIFIDADACPGTEPIRLEEVSPQPKAQPFTTHIGSISDIMYFTEHLCGVTPKVYLLAIKGLSFEVGEGLSPVAVKNSEEALLILNKLINESFPLA